ncbi:MAG: DUF1294 domain-containing protein [Clostridia bacterium]|nr:DUF1294 domain-containing protein [Clostridia bacterium]
MEQILTIKNILIYFIIINCIGFLSMLIDKQKAKKGAWRIPEKTLFIIAILGGSIGSIFGMYSFRHKTKKLKFSVGIPVIIVLQIMLILYLVKGNLTV